MPRLDIFDALTVVGLALVCVGLWLLHPAAAFCAAGAVLFLAGVRGETSRRRSR